MTETKPTPKDQKPKPQLHLSMKDFSFFGKDTDAVILELKTILDSGHTLCLEMTQSTSLSNDLFTLDRHLAYDAGYEMHMRYKRDEYEKAQVIVILQKEVVA
tara:strand:- start:129 stop:434 length:306 start_codon:yes stop_codon:yes gene_type:complete